MGTDVYCCERDVRGLVKSGKEWERPVLVGNDWERLPVSGENEQHLLAVFPTCEPYEKRAHKEGNFRDFQKKKSRVNVNFSISITKFT